jgi:histidinol phosphatase-like enzyme (inositol monophosphatase family)
MSITDAELRNRFELARSAARAAGQLTLEYFRRDVRIDRKADGSPVTMADREAEQLLRDQIARAFPGDGIVGEEYAETKGSSGFRWILDPIDGTKSFICGVPLYGTLVGVERDGRSEIGVIYMPGLDECVYAQRGFGAWYERSGAAAQPARTSSCVHLAEGLLVTSQVDSFAHRNAWFVYQQLEKAASITRTWGDCYGYLLVATGRAAVMIDPQMNLWDAAAVQPILEEAGGTFTDWQGEPTIASGDGIGTNGHVLHEVLAVTKPFAKRTARRAT